MHARSSGRDSCKSENACALYVVPSGVGSKKFATLCGRAPAPCKHECRLQVCTRCTVAGSPMTCNVSCLQKMQVEQQSGPLQQPGKQAGIPCGSAFCLATALCLARRYQRHRYRCWLLQVRARCPGQPRPAARCLSSGSFVLRPRQLRCLAHPQIVVS